MSIMASIIRLRKVILKVLRIPVPDDQATGKEADQVARLSAALRGSPKATTALMTDLGLSHRPTFRKNYLHSARSAGLVEMTRLGSPSAKN